MNPARSEVSVPEVLAQIQALALPLSGPDDLDAVVNQVGGARFVGIGEASHGTHEFYHWRGALSRRLIEEHGFTWIGVEGDWPDCWRINRWVRGHTEQHLDARGLLERFERWPTWMWANQDVAAFLDWLLVPDVPGRLVAAHHDAVVVLGFGGHRGVLHGVESVFVGNGAFRDLTAYLHQERDDIRLAGFRDQTAHDGDRRSGRRPPGARPRRA